MVPVVSSVALRQTKKQKKTSDEKTEKKQKQRKNNRKKGYGPKFHFSIESVHNEMAKAFLRQTPDFSEFSSPSRPDFLGGAGGEKDGKNKAAESAERKIGGHLAKKKTNLSGKSPKNDFPRRDHFGYCNKNTAPRIRAIWEGAIF